MRIRTAIVMLPLLLLAALFILAACVTSGPMAKVHPVEVTAPALCSKCHTDQRAALDHRSDYITRHRFYAAQDGRVCSVCHNDAFCSDCHAHKEELKPSDKYRDAPERDMPHRGDYLNQHKIDGRINPASCFPCHGRQNNERCIVCHR